MSSKFSSAHVRVIVDSAPEGKYGTFVPGQTISGKAIYTPQLQVDIDMVEVVFKGKCFTQITETNANNGTTSKTTHFREKIVLFRYSQTVFRGPHTIPAGTYEWPFTFKLPEKAMHNRKAQTKDHLFQMGEQDLPPSFKLKCDVHADPPKAEVTYQIKAKINPGRLMHSAQGCFEVPVWPVSLTPLAKPLPLDGPCHGNGRFKDRRLRPAQHTFKEKMSHIFTSDPALKTPEINISVSVKIPRIVGVSQPMPIEISCNYRRTGENDPKDPNLVLMDCRIILKTYADVRAMRTTKDHMKPGKQTVVSHTIRGNKNTLPLDGSFIPITTPLCLADMTSKVHGLVPNFKTWTINTTYKLTIKIRIRHADIDHAWEFENKRPFEILPENLPTPGYTPLQPAAYVEPDASALYPPQLSSEAQASSRSQFPPAFNGALAPPSYDSDDVWRARTDAKGVY